MPHTATKPFETPRLICRPFTMADCGDMLRNWIADEDIQNEYGEPVYTTLPQVEKLVGEYVEKYSNADFYRWAIIEKDCGECIGQIAYFLVDSKNHFAEIEYCIGSEFQCRGYATEAAKAVIAFGFDEINLHKVQICTKTINQPSKRVIEKCGLTYEGTLRDYFYMYGEYVGRHYFSILRSEYEKND